MSAPVDYTRDEYNELVIAMLSDTLDALDVEQTHVIGGSIGNAWVTRLAQAEPSRVRRIVWLGSTALEELGVPTHIRLLASPLGRVIIPLGEREKIMRRQLRGQIGHATAVDSGAMDAFLHWRAIEAKAIHFLHHERNMVKAMQNRNGWLPRVAIDDTDLTELAQPTLLIYGTNDPLGSVDLWQDKVSRIPQGEIEVVQDGGHLPWYDKPDHVGQVVSAFLRP